MSQRSVKPDLEALPETVPEAAGADAPRFAGGRKPFPRKGQTSREGLSQTVAAAADLLAEGDRAHAGIATDARDLLLDEIEPDPAQPRRHFDAEDLRALAEDIARRGVLQPILVRPPAMPGGPFRLVAGERRWRATRLAGKVRIPARIRNLSDEDVQAAQLAENVLRAGLTDIEKGRALRRLYEIRKTQNYKVTWEDVAAEVGLGRARIHDLFQLASLPDAVSALIESGRLSGSHGIALQRAQGQLPETVLISLAERAARPEERRSGGHGLSVARLRMEIQQNTGNADTAETSARLAGPSQGASEATALLGSEGPRPFVRRVLEALSQQALTDDERSLLEAALQDARTG